MFLPPVSSPAYLPSQRAAGPRAVGATAAVAELRRHETGPDLDAKQARRLEHLRSRDRELRQNERAQVLLGGTLVRTLPSYTYERGPDGNFYAIDGVANVDMAGRGMLDAVLPRRPEPASEAAPDSATESPPQPAPQSTAQSAPPSMPPPESEPARRKAPAVPQAAAGEAIVATPARLAAQGSATTQRIDDDFAAAAARFYLASANPAPRRPIVDLFA